MPARLHRIAGWTGLTTLVTQVEWVLIKQLVVASLHTKLMFVQLMIRKNCYKCATLKFSWKEVNHDEREVLYMRGLYRFLLVNGKHTYWNDQVLTTRRIRKYVPYVRLVETNFISWDWGETTYLHEMLKATRTIKSERIRCHHDLTRRGRYCIGEGLGRHGIHAACNQEL